jgi:hypothetical protein
MRLVNEHTIDQTPALCCRTPVATLEWELFVLSLLAHFIDDKALPGLDLIG